MAFSSIDPPELASIRLKVYPNALSQPGPPVTKQVIRTILTGPALGSLLGPTYSPKGLPGPVIDPRISWGPLAQQEKKVIKNITVAGTPPQAISGPSVQFDHFLEYAYDQDFLTPADGWHFTIDGDELSDVDRRALTPGAKIEISVGDNQQTTGYLRRVKTTSSSGGTIITVEGRDWLSRAVDAHIDPINTRFDATMNLEQLLNQVFVPFGMQVSVNDNSSNRNAQTGGIYGTRLTKKGKIPKSVALYAIKPRQSEGAFQFAARVCERFGLWLWPSNDGKTLIVSTPDFDQPARYQIRHKIDRSEGNNVLDSYCEVSDSEQPSIIFASAVGGGGEYSRGSLRGAIINPLVAIAPEQHAKLLAPYKGISLQTPTLPTQATGAAAFPILNPFATPIYLYDPDAHTQDQLDAFLRRELALRMRKQLTLRYTIMGHRINNQPVAVDTIVNVDDDRHNVQGDFWVMSRRFSKGHSGTRTEITLIRPGTLVF